MTSVRVVLPLSETSAWVLDGFDVDLKHEPFLIGVSDGLVDLASDTLPPETTIGFFLAETVPEPGATKPNCLNA